MSERRGGWMQTFEGRAFWPLDPHIDDLSIEDIAHHLAMQVRYCGAVRKFYSTAEHCVILSYAVPADLALAALLHDAAEAYLGDMIRPLKQEPEFSAAYRAVEATIEPLVAERFDVPWPWPPQVMWADSAILGDESAQDMAPPPIPWNLPNPPLGVRVQCWSPVYAEFRFLRRFRELDAARRTRSHFFLAAGEVTHV